MKKTLMYAVIVVAVAILLYFTYGFLNTSETPVTTEESLQNEGITVSNLNPGHHIVRYGDNYVYTNDEFGFELTLPKAWEGLNPRDVGGSEFSLQSIYFQVPTVYCNETPNPKTGDCYVVPLIITVYSKPQWNVANQGALKPALIAENDRYVFAYATWQDTPIGMEKLDFMIPSVVSSFRFK